MLTYNGDQALFLQACFERYENSNRYMTFNTHVAQKIDDMTQRLIVKICQNLQIIQNDINTITNTFECIINDGHCNDIFLRVIYIYANRLKNKQIAINDQILKALFVVAQKMFVDNPNKNIRYIKIFRMSTEEILQLEIKIMSSIDTFITLEEYNDVCFNL